MSEVIQSRLIRRAALFLFIYSGILTLSPAVRERSWDVNFRVTHWIAFLVWGVLTYISHIVSAKFLQDHDPFILPAASLLTGWGLLTVWRLDDFFGIRQTVWYSISMCLFILMMRFSSLIVILKRYKYLLLTFGLLVTGLTILFGTNPLGVGPRLWLGCCGFFFQPSEPLKLLLVIYLAAYFADRHPIALTTFPLIIPTIILTGVALLLLMVQRDLGTASIFIFIYTIILFLATGKKRVLFGTFILLLMMLFVGYISTEIIRSRVDGLINPWEEPSGRSYQIVQSLLAIANGGTMGRGPGLGNPLLVPVAISDFIFSAIAEETGLVGIIGLLAAIWLILSRGILISLRAPDRFRRLLTAGIVTYLGVQSILIIGGNLRLLPLTGVTLPFMSYGGSSLLTSIFAVGLLMVSSVSGDSEPASLSDQNPYKLLAALFGVALILTAFSSAWWTIIRGPALLNRTDNARRSIADRYVPRGDIVDRNNRPLNITEGTSGSYTRTYLYPEIAPLAGYTHPVYGQAGLEASMDDYLRGLKGNPASLLWWDHLLYGTPPPGLDVRLSIDLEIQSKADQLLGKNAGALILMNARTGEILAMASHPTFDPNNLDADGQELIQNPSAPLLNRATQGLYPAGSVFSPLIQTKFAGNSPSRQDLENFYQELGLLTMPQINLPVSGESTLSSSGNLRVSPLQTLLAFSSLSNGGVIPAPRIAIAINTSQQGWVVLTPSSQPFEALKSKTAAETASSLIVEGKPYWRYIVNASMNNSTVTWAISGTFPDWGGTPLVLVIALEQNNPLLAESIQEQLFDAVLK